MRARFAVLAGALLVGGVLAACGNDDDALTSESDRLTVVTTVAPITNIVANVVGDAADIEGIVPQGVDSHTFEPTPSIAELFERADVVFLNGLQLEEPTKRMAEAHLRGGAVLVELGDLTVSPDEWVFDFSFPEEEGMPNPHLWTDPTLAVRYAEIIKDTMAGVDPGNSATYEVNFAAFAVLVDEFDAAARETFASLPPERRKLLTYHDSWPYFARTYGWEVIGAIQPADFSEPSPREVARLIEQLREEDVPAIFGSEVFPSPVLEQIAREAGVEYVDDLRDDELPGEPGEPEHSWLGMMRFNFVTMVQALGGDPTPVEEFEARNVVEDRARYR